MRRDHITSIIVKAALAFVLAVFIPAAVNAQEYENAPVEVSKDKVRIGGQVCYSHIVLEKQTLYSISKAYNVSLEDIYKYNPSVKENGLKKNSILIIPVAEKSEETKAAEEVKQTQPEPKAEEQVRPEQTQEQKDRPKTQARSKRKTHTVKWYEDIEGIAKKYEVSVNAIMQANSLTSKKLTKRQKLVIPDPGEYSDEDFAAAGEEMAAADTTAAADSLQEDRDWLFPGLLFPKKEVNLSLLMPLKATGSSANSQNMDFYSGVLLAVYDMYREGISTNLNVYDVAGGIPADGDLSDSDIIIGPVASGDISSLFEAVPDAKAVISPLDPRAENIAYTQKAMIHVPTPHAVQYRDLVSWIREDMKPGDRVLFITEKGARQTDATASMTAAIDSSGIEYTPLSYSILEGRDVTETLAYLMTETNTNRVYIASESEAFVNDVVRNLNVMIHQKYDVVLYAPSKIRSFETIEVENFHNTKMRVSLGYYIDYNDAKVKEFLLKYRALFNTEPTQFAYQGYDIARHFIDLCSKYGNRWMNRIVDTDASMLQSSFDFTATPDGGYINNGVRRIIYGENWNVEKIR